MDDSEFEIPCLLLVYCQGSILSQLINVAVKLNQVLTELRVLTVRGGIFCEREK